MSSTPATQKKSWIDKSLDAIERVCNKLPPPGILFIYLFVIVAILGAIVSATGASLVNPANGETVVAKNFFTGEGIQWLL
ncbi:MAG: AbgT family transporter, partial [Oscillospiraceae bacterium]|nr:AbgT family transporter [Oscillospiraceae bacterium]